MDLFRKSCGHLIKAKSTEVTVATVWSLSLRSVREQSPAAVALLQVAAFLPPDNFPRDRLRRPRVKVSGPLATVLGDEVALNDAIAVLRRYSLIEASPRDISVHRLVQVVVQKSLTPTESVFFPRAAHRLQYGGGPLEEPTASETTGP